MDLITSSRKIIASIHFLYKIELHLITNSYTTITKLYNQDINIKDI